MIKRLAIGALGLGISGLILYWMAGLVDWGKFFDSLPDDVTVPLLASSLLYAVTLFVRSVRFSWLFGRIAETRVSILSAFDLVALNNVLNHLLPLRAGEIAFVTLAKRNHDVTVTESTLILFVARLGDLAGLLLGVAVAIWWIPVVPVEVRLLLLALALVATASLWWADVAVRVGHYFVGHVARVLPKKLGSKMNGVLAKLGEVTPLLRDRSLFSLNLGLSALIWLVNTVFFFVVVRIIALDVSFAQVFIGGSGAALLPSLPINAFGTLGTLEAGWAAGFLLVGVAKEPATASGFVLHGVILFISGITGAIASRVIWTRRSAAEVEAPPVETEAHKRDAARSDASEPEQS